MKHLPNPSPSSSRRRKVSSSSLEILEARVCPSSFTVLNLADQGVGSLRQAIADANAHPGVDHILFATTGTGVIHLNSGELLITDSVVISGPGASKLAISAGESSRVFNISAQATTITDLTVRDGNATGPFGKGGGVQITGTGRLTLDSVTLTANRADQDGGGLYVGSGTVAELVNVTLSGNRTAADGGGLSSAGKVILQSTQITNNRAQVHGGGIDNMAGGVLAMFRSLIAGNFAAGGGGGLRNVSSSTSNIGDETAGTVLIFQSTMTGNICTGFPGGGAVSSSAGGIFMVLSTIVGNSDTSDTSTSTGGMSISGSSLLFISNSTVADNGAGAGHGPDFDGAIDSTGRNVVGSTLGSTGIGGGSDTVGVSAGVAALADYGGPKPTMVTLPNSAALNKGSTDNEIGTRAAWATSAR